MSRDRTPCIVEDCLCGSGDIALYKLPAKEFLVKCECCGYSLMGKGVQWMKMQRDWNKDILRRKELTAEGEE